MTSTRIGSKETVMATLYAQFQILRSFARCETGATALEYALIAGFVSIVIVGAVLGLGDTVSGMYNDTATAVQ
jgi:pilus assembly protein Flp/PilA